MEEVIQPKPEVQTEYCSNCKRDIPSINFMMHVNHCRRNITLCKSCDEPIPTSQQEEHFEEYHAKVKCECGVSMEKMNLEDHKEKDCTSRKVTCEYCELELAFSEMGAHKEYCSCRTEPCDKCRKYIKLKDMDEHLQSDCKKPPAIQNNMGNSSSSQNGFDRPYPGEMLRNVGFQDPENYPQSVDAHTLRALFSMGLVGADHLRVARDVPVERPSVFSHSMGRSDYVVARGPAGTQIAPQRYHSRHYEDDDDEEFEEAPRKQLENDELMAALLASQLQEAVGSMTEGAFGRFIEPLPAIIPADQVDDMDESDINNTPLPCEFCDQLFPLEDLIQHQSGCQLMSAHIPSSSPPRYPNLRSPPHSLPPMVNYDDHHQIESLTNGTDGMHTGTDIKDDMDITFLPCEFCQELFPTDVLIMHQSVCDPLGSRPPSALPSSMTSTVPHVFPDSGPGPAIPNNARSNRNTRPPRPSRPVMVDDRGAWTPSFQDFISNRDVDRSDDAIKPQTNDDIPGRTIPGFGCNDTRFNNSRAISPMEHETLTQSPLLEQRSKKSNIETRPREMGVRTVKTEYKDTSGQNNKTPSKNRPAKKSNHSIDTVGTREPLDVRIERSVRDQRRGPSESSFSSLNNSFGNGGARGTGTPAARVAMNQNRTILQSDPIPSSGAKSRRRANDTGLPRTGLPRTGKPTTGKPTESPGDTSLRVDNTMEMIRPRTNRSQAPARTVGVSSTREPASSTREAARTGEQGAVNRSSTKSKRSRRKKIA